MYTLSSFDVPNPDGSVVAAGSHHGIVFKELDTVYKRRVTH